MRKPNIKNKYNLTFSDIKKLQIGDTNKICEPLFWRNNVINAWCISENTIKTPKDSKFSSYNDYWIGIYDLNAKQERKIKVNCSAYGGMATYKFNKFFNYKDIESEEDLEIQEKLLNKINELIDKGILKISC